MFCKGKKYFENPSLAPGQAAKRDEHGVVAVGVRGRPVPSPVVLPGRTVIADQPSSRFRHLDAELLAERAKRGLHLIQPRTVSQVQQPIDLGQMAVQPPRQFRFPDALVTSWPEVSRCARCNEEIDSKPIGSICCPQDDVSVGKAVTDGPLIPVQRAVTLPSVPG